jgi:two-component sensor histidine kinase/tetratricopeptide (TPR) repeat protein
MRSIGCIFFISFIGCFLAITGAGCNGEQDSRKRIRPDTLVIRELMEHGERCLDRPGSNAADMDSAMNIAGEIERISTSLQYTQGLGLSKLLRAKTLREMGQAIKAREPATQAVEILSRSGAAKDKASALIELGGTYSNNGDDLSRKIALYEQGMRIYSGLGDKLTEAKLREFIGDLYLLKQDTPNAVSNLTKALALYQEVGFKRLQGVYGLIGSAYIQRDNFLESLRYNTLAIKIGEQMKDSGALMANLYNRLGSSYWYIENNQQALTNFRKGASIARANKDSAGVRDILGNIARVLTRKKAYQEALDTIDAALTVAPRLDVYSESDLDVLRLYVYTLMSDWHHAEIYFRKLKKTYEAGVLDNNMTQSLRYAMASYLIKAGKFEVGRQYLDALSQGVEGYPIIMSRRAAVEYLYYQADSAAGNLHSAIKHFKRFKTISDSSRSMIQSKQLGELQLNFEMEKKDNDIKLLMHKSKMQEASLQKEKVIRNVVIAGVLVLIVFLALIYSRYRNKKLMNIRLEKQQNEINKQNDDLRKLLDDKEWLLKEIHHRVKNNLQVMISLLNTQSRYLNNKDALDAIRNSQQRMYSMSLIHQRLYQTDNLSKIDMRWYIPELIGYMKDGLETEDNIQFIVDSDKIDLEVIQAVPLGLILNEAISNSLKYAFPEGGKGTITVRLKMEDDKNCQLSISDNGIGIQDPEAALESDSLGMRLMQGLSEQLDGEFELRNNYPGVLICVAFPYHEFVADNRKYILN